MKILSLSHNAIRLAALAAALAATSPALAGELSPWLGSPDQTPFQLDPVTMVAVTFAADPLHTGSTSKAPCQPKTCLSDGNTATEASKSSGAPQN